MKKKWLIFVGIGLAIAAVARKCTSMCTSSTDQSTEGAKSTKWDKMRARMEQMPEDFPPRVMFDNVQIARDNTERILGILQAEESEASGAEALAGAPA